MKREPVVSVIIPFYNTAPQFLQEAIESVLQQTYSGWELLVVDDGSTGESTQVAQDYAARYPGQVRYLDHAGHENRGISASRQLGVQYAGGRYIALLDGDDVWLPNKLEQQVGILDAQPEAGMLYGNTLYWHSWTGAWADIKRDYLPHMGVPAEVLVRPPQLLAMYLNGQAAVPCTCSVLVRRTALEAVGGFESAFRGMFEDQVLYAKMCLSVPVFVSGQSWDKYRQHSDSMCEVAAQRGQLDRAYVTYLHWLQRYLAARDIRQIDVWQALRRQLWLQQPAWPHLPAGVRIVARRARKWLLRFEQQALPAPMRRWLWTRGRQAA